MQIVTSETLDALDGVMRTLELRKPTSIPIVKKQNSPWREFSGNPRVLHSEVTRLVETAFDLGGYVAGGCARWLFNNNMTALDRGVYVHEGGDIDLFFRTTEGWRAFVDACTKVEKLDVTISKGRLAMNATFKTEGIKIKRPPTIQAIRCSIGAPEHVLASFDLLNSMVAFDRDHTWRVEGWEELEANKTLAVAWWGSKSNLYRLTKYVNKYGYSRLVDMSEDIIGQLLTSCADHAKPLKTYRDIAWMKLLRDPRLHMDLELTATIGACVFSDGLPSYLLFEANRTDHVYSTSRFLGYVEYLKRTILERKEMFAKHPRQGDYLEPSWCEADGTFSPEMYCWAV